VTKSFAGGVIAVDHASLEVEEGEFITLLGPSGCGKSTILRMIAGFESPDSGQIFLGDIDVTELPPYRRNVNMVFQDYALFPHMNVRQNVGYGLKVSGVDKQEIRGRVDDALQLVELQDKADNSPGQLSGGQRQRVSLARALVREPRVLLLDEPLSALDANLREAMQVELRHLHQKLGLTFVMVTHDQTEALAMADRIVVMESGRIAQCGSPLELYDQPESPYVARFIGSSSFIRATIESTSGDQYIANIGGNLLRVSGATRRFNTGEPVDLCVRPEKIRLVELDTTEADQEANTLVGKVSNLVYHGASVRLQVELRDGQFVLVDIPLDSARRHGSLPDVDSHVGLAIRSEDILLFEPARPE